MVSQLQARGRNAALYQRLLFLPTQEQAYTLTHTEREAKACVWGQARVFDSEVHAVSSSSVRNCVKHRKHNARTVLQVVSEAQLATDFTVDVLFCSAEGGVGCFSAFPLHTYGRKDANGSSEWLYE